MKLSKTLTDAAVTAEIGRRITEKRLEMEMTQVETAEKAGIGKRTLERFDNGESVQLTSFIRILRVLDLLDNLNEVVPEKGYSPVEMLKLEGQVRKRARTKQKSDSPDKNWKWGDG